ncbi:MAG: Asp-tRNA(Asn)/Glu-tRNA(Gln) amidotransferase subunit GatC [Bryobacterales bacterium]|nr:Asp-tRNA(Asn)/Glu-tRNA(Gln) amidotransferase subunit GatC [Bryobacterales bacterium]
MKITPEEVQHIAALANLRLSPAEIQRYARDLEEILAYVDQLNELDTSGVTPMAQVLHEGSVPALRADEQGPSFGQETALRCAPLSGAGHFKVPRVIER